jgi:hypothetical protein
LDHHRSEPNSTVRCAAGEDIGQLRADIAHEVILRLAPLGVRDNGPAEMTAV